MATNRLRVVCNPLANHISYYYKNELNEWLIVSGSSPLSRNYYTNTTIRERGIEIVKKLDEVYNRKNKGLEIIFEGDKENYTLLSDAISSSLAGRNVWCRMGGTKVIVAGKAGAGKTVLIEEIEKLYAAKYSIIETEEYFLYKDENNTEWYEIKGIDFGIENVRRAYDSICKIANDTSAIIVYCIHSSNRRIETVESTFILKLVDTYPELAGMIVLTQCTNKDGLIQFVDEIEKLTDQIKVVPVLAREFPLDIENKDTGEPIVLKPFGLEKLAEYVFEGR